MTVVVTLFSTSGASSYSKRQHSLGEYRHVCGVVTLLLHVLAIPPRLAAPFPQHYATGIKKTADHLVGVLNDAMNFWKLSDSSDKFVLEPIDFDPLVLGPKVGSQTLMPLPIVAPYHIISARCAIKQANPLVLWPVFPRSIH